MIDYIDEEVFKGEVEKLKSNAHYICFVDGLINLETVQKYLPDMGLDEFRQRFPRIWIHG